MPPLQTSVQTKKAQTAAQGLGYSGVDAVRKAILPPKTSSFEIDVPPATPSTALSKGTTYTDARANRDSREAQQTALAESKLAFSQGLAGIQANPQSTDLLSGLMFPQATETTQQRDTLVGEQRGLLQQARDFITGRKQDSAGRLTSLQEEAGLPDLQARIATSNERVAQLRGELMKARPQIEGEAGQTRIGAEARLGPVERNLQAEIASEALVQSALVGNAQMVQSNIDQILQLEFQDQQAELQDMMLGIQMVGQEIQTLDPKLQEEANQRLAQFNFAVQERATALQTAQQNKAGVLQILSQAAQNGAPQQVLDTIKMSQTPDQAIASASGYMVDPMERKIQQAQLDNIYDQIRERKANDLSSGEGTLNGKPQTAGQAKVNGYADRLAQANKTITDIGSDFSHFYSIGGSMPNILQTSGRQVYEQAKRNFVNAVLRQESGAVISPSEFDNAQRQYFPQAGDSAEVIAQKEANRNTSINNLYREANTQRPAIAGDIIESDGKKYKVALDGVTLEEI